jgi:UDPglucose 6-dehydrogenase
MKITVIGSGYVGLVTGACLAEMGNHVLCLDLDQGKIDRLLKGQIPIFEPGLEDLVVRNASAGRLEFTTDIKRSVEHGTLQFIAVGTPPGEDGSADLKYVMDAASNIGRHMTSYKMVIDKSTVPVGTSTKVSNVLKMELEKRNLSIEYAVVSNPEFLKEGAAIEDFMRPDRIVIGVDDSKSEALLRALYRPFVRNHDRILVMDRNSAELTKYAANAMLATRISFMNELARISEKVGADIELVRQGIGSDPRIGFDFLYAGCGYGGSCFPKDVRALQMTAEKAGVSMRLLEAVEAVNDEQKLVLVGKVLSKFGKQIAGKRIAVWGLAFKPNTDDVREAPSFVVIKELLSHGATVCAFDPVAVKEAQHSLGPLEGLSYASSSYAALDGADALVIVTEWKEFRTPDFEVMRERMNELTIFDGRNLYDPSVLAASGFTYYPIGRVQPTVE